MVVDIIIITINFCVAALFCSRVYWLIKYEHKDPLKAVKPWWIENQTDHDIVEEFNSRG